jgi:hypothetical protein
MTDSDTPKATPHKGFGPFPAFRLTNGVMKADDGSLERSVESCDIWAERSAIAVIVGLVLEVGIAFTHPPFDSFWEHWGAVLADMLVALGVAGEVLFGRMGRSRQSELTRRSSGRLAQAEFDMGFALAASEKATEVAGDAQRKLAVAIDRAAKLEREAARARLETERIKSEVSWRIIDRGTSSRLVAGLSKNPSDATLVFVSGEPESTEYCAQLWKIFKQAGWNASVAGRIFLGPLVGTFVTQNERFTPDIQARIALIQDAFTAAGFPWEKGGGAVYSREPGMGTGVISAEVMVVSPTVV